MATRETIKAYFAALQKKEGWEELLDAAVIFTSFTSPVKQLSGKPAFLEGTRRFYGSIRSLEIRELMVDGDRACALTRYQIQTPVSSFPSDVAEVFTVRAGKIQSFGIYFDSAPYPK